MRIKEINLQHYGPLPKFIKEFDEGIHVIYGTNESGKTLLIDAVMKMLVGGKKHHPSMNRVEQSPSGFVLLDKDGDEIKLDEKETLETMMDIDSDDLRNIFCIRDADLQISEETKFYERTQDKIAGLRSADLRQIIEALRTKGRLTPSGDGLSNSRKTNYAKTVYSNSRNLISEIKDYLKLARDEKVEELELELQGLKSGMALLDDTLSLLHKAKQKQEFEKIRDEYNTLVDLNTASKEIPQDKINELSGLISRHDENPINKSETRRKLDLYKTLSIASFGIGFLSLILTYVLRLPTIVYLSPIIFILGGFYSVVQWNSSNSDLSEMETLESDLFAISNQLEIKSDTVRGVKAELDRINAENEELRKNLYRREGVVRDFFNVESDKLEEVISMASDLLATLEEGIDREVSIEYSQADYERIKEEIDTNQSRIDEICKLLEGHHGQLDDFRSQISKLNYPSFMEEELDIIIDNLDSLESVLPFLENLKDKIEMDRDASSEAISIFVELETEEEQKITELFTEDSSAVEIFKDTTNGRYSDLRYDIDTGSIIVERPNGETLNVSKLSKGTRDQLYLAIRVALGEKLLEGSPGFFIMDDAFLSSDEHRLQSQVELLEKLVKKGWQIIYVTMKKDALDNISKITDNEVIILSQLA